MDKNYAKAKGNNKSLAGSNNTPPHSDDHDKIFYNYLRQFSTSKDEPFTHTSIGHPKGSYNVPNEELPNLHKLLANALKAGKNIMLHLTEKPTNPSQLKIDLDFRFDINLSDRLYKVEHVMGIVKLYNRAIKEYVDIPESDIQAFVFQRDTSYKFGGNTKDGIHIMYPYVMVDTTIQYMIRDYVLENCSSIFSDLPLKNSYDDVVDRAVIAKNNWLMYGCTKPNCKEYKLTHILNYDMSKELLNKPMYSIDKLVVTLSNLNVDKAVYKILPGKQEEYDKLNEKIKVKEKRSRRGTIGLKKSFMLTKRGNSSLGDNSNRLDEIKSLVELLGDYRADDEIQWMEVGWCLHNIDNTLIDLWIDFSRRSNKFVPGECEKLWGNFKDENLGIGSLHRWAKQDNNLKYREVIRSSITNYILKSVTCTTYDIARVVYEMFKHQYVCVSIRHNIWYEYRNHRWYEIDSGIGLKQKISNEVLAEYLTLVAYYNDLAQSADNNTKDQYLVKSKALVDVTFKLRDYTFKEKVMKESINFFYNADFINKLDANPYLIGFENGVYDLKKGEFRDGRPEDYVSMTTGNEYMEFDDDDDTVEEIYDFMEKIFPISDVREYVFILLASFLCGLTLDQKFHVWTGKGGNGKSKLIELFELAFGNYCVKLPVTLLTQKRGASNAASPELARTKGARFASMQEPDENERLNIGLLKELSGSDRIMTRALYKEPLEFKPQFKLALCCNHLPKVPPDDDGTWRRIRVVEFIAKFTDTPDPENPNEHYKDYQLDEKLARWKEAFMFILLEYYKKYKEHGLFEPEEVKKATREYQKTSDIYIEFIDDTIVKDSNSIIRLDDTYGHFKVWYRQSFDGKCPSRRDFKIGMEKKFGKYVAGGKGGWPGYRFIPQTADDEDALGSIPSGVITEEDPTPVKSFTQQVIQPLNQSDDQTSIQSAPKKIINLAKIAKKT